jgi:alkylated DNA repair protein alkB family protein 8
VIDDFITSEEEQTLIENIDKQEWNKLSHRRVQHYGYEFIYGANNINKNNKIGPIPEFGLDLSKSNS